MGIQDSFLNDEGLIAPRITSFFEEASIYVPNKFIVLMYGEYVNKALAKIEKDLGNTQETRLNRVYRRNFENWYTKHVNETDKNNKVVDLKWTCKSVNIPSSSAEMEEGSLNLDTTKSIRYPLIKTHTLTQTITMGIVEDRNVMMYQFFNALINQFFVPGALKPRSSFHKLSILITTLIQTGETSSKNNLILGDLDRDIHSIPGQIFEFNSAVLSKLDDMKLSNVSTTGPLEYNVSFKVPNTFQNSFNTGISGQRDDISDTAVFQGNTLDRIMLQKNKEGRDTEINLSKFETTESELRSVSDKFLDGEL